MTGDLVAALAPHPQLSSPAKADDPDAMGGEAAARETLGRRDHAREPPMSQSFDASKSLTAFEQDSTLVAVIEMSQSKWLVAAVVPGIARQPLKKRDTYAGALLRLMH